MMKSFVSMAVLATTFSILSVSASQAALVSAAGGLSSAGVAPTIIAAPADATDDAAYNSGIEGFDEQQFYTLLNPLTVDSGVTLAAGIVVSSHMIFLNSGPGNNSTLIEHGAGGNQNAATFTFDGNILGVMSDSLGALEVASQFLGAAGTIYPGATLGARGLEGDPLDGSTANDWYSITGNQISLGMRVTEPGDWIRVVTVAAVPVPASLPLLGIVLAVFAAVFGRRRRQSV